MNRRDHLKQIGGALVGGATVSAVAVPESAEAASITFTVDDAQLPTILAALRRRIPQGGGETTTNYVKRCVYDSFLRPIVDDHLRLTAAEAVVPTASGQLGTD